MPSSDELPAAALARFGAAEAQLYPLALVDPDEYERVTRVVGRLAAELRIEGPDIATVLDLREAMIARVPIIAAEAGLTIAGLPREAVADAASAIRCRELQAARSASRWTDRLEAARSAGDGVDRAGGGHPGGPGRPLPDDRLARPDRHRADQRGRGRIGRSATDLHDRDCAAGSGGPADRCIPTGTPGSPRSASSEPTFRPAGSTLPTRLDRRADLPFAKRDSSCREVNGPWRAP